MKLTKKQQQLLTRLAHVFYALEDECEESDEFNDIMADNNDLFPMSIGELAGEWLRLAVGERGTEVERSDDSEEEFI